MTESSDDEVVGMVSINRPKAGPDPLRPRSGGAALILALVTALALVGAVVLGTLRIGSLTDRIDTLEEQTDANSSDIQTLISVYQTLGSGSSSAALPEGHLPAYDPTLTNDPAIGMVLGPVSVAAHPDGAATTIDPADGQPRVWLVWAHWCPHCQAELPALAGIYDQIEDGSVALVTVSTNQDPTRGNPQDEYLEASAFPFPVFIDSNDAAASQMGVSSFPSWIITNGDGAVVSRWSGEIGAESVLQLFSDLDAYFSETS